MKPNLTIEINNDEYTKNEYKRLKAKWGMRVGERDFLGDQLTKVYPWRINEMRGMGQKLFNEWYLWKFPRPTKKGFKSIKFIPENHKQLSFFNNSVSTLETTAGRCDEI